MSEQINTTADEIDLLYLYKKLKRIVRGWIRAMFNALDFCLRNWIIILVLLIVGVGLGYYLQQNQAVSKEAKVLIKVNFDAGSYLYSAAQVLDRKIGERDAEFLQKIGLDTLRPSINGLELEPIIDVKDITEDFEVTDRNLDPILRYVEFNMEEEELYQTFAHDYNYHYLKIRLSPRGTVQDINKVLDYLNASELLKEHKNTALSTIQEKLDANKESIAQINSFLEEYLKKQRETTVPNAAYYVERDMRPDLLMTTKNDLLLENKTLQQEMVYYKDAVVPMSGLEVFPSASSLFDKKIIVLPILLIGAFLLLALFRHLYFSLRAIANKEDA